MIKFGILYIFSIFILQLEYAEGAEIRKTILFEQVLFRLDKKTYYLSDFKNYIQECDKYKRTKGKQTVLSSILVESKEISEFFNFGKKKVDLRAMTFQIRKYVHFSKMKTYFLAKELDTNNLKNSTSHEIRLLNQIDKYFVERFMVRSGEIGSKESGDINESIKLFLINLDRKIIHNVFF